MQKGPKSVNLPMQQCLLEQRTREPLYYFKNTPLYSAACFYGPKVIFKDINLIIKDESASYKKVQRLLDGKVWILSNRNCKYIKQKRYISYKKKSKADNSAEQR